MINRWLIRFDPWNFTLNELVLTYFYIKAHLCFLLFSKQFSYHRAFAIMVTKGRTVTIGGCDTLVVNRVTFMLDLTC